MTTSDQSKMLDSINSLVRKKSTPRFNGRNWSSLVEQHRNAIISAPDDVAFERQMNVLLDELGTSHTAFFNGSTNVPSRNSINATFQAYQTQSGLRWIFQDVQPDGPAAPVQASSPGTCCLRSMIIRSLRLTHPTSIRR